MPFDQQDRSREEKMRSISYRAAVTGVFLVVSLAALGGVLVNAYSSTSTALLRLSDEIVGKLSGRVVQRVGDISSAIESHLYVKWTNTYR